MCFVLSSIEKEPRSSSPRLNHLGAAASTILTSVDRIASDSSVFTLLNTATHRAYDHQDKLLVYSAFLYFQVLLATLSDNVVVSKQTGRIRDKDRTWDSVKKSLLGNINGFLEELKVSCRRRERLKRRDAVIFFLLCEAAIAISPPRT